MTGLQVLALVALAAPPLSAEADQWPQFRGSGARGIAEGGRPPERWGADLNVAWKSEIPGRGWSSPIVWGDRIFLTSVVAHGEVEAPKKGLYFGGERPLPPAEHRWLVHAVDWETGKLLWQREAHRGVPPSPRHLKNSFASETPVTDGERLYAYFGNLGVFCYDFSGKLLWTQRFDANPMRYGWGTAASPVLHQGRLYIVNDNDRQSFLIALDARTGKILWRVERQERSNWATPYVWSNERRTEIVTPGSGGIRSYDLDGKLLWQLGPMSSIAIPTPFSAFGLLYVASGYVGDDVRPVYAIRPGGAGDLTLAKDQENSDFIAWSLRQGGPYNPSPLVYGDHYYTLYDRGFLTCHDARTGKEVYGKVRIDAEAGAFTSSPWAYGGKIFAQSEDGDTYVIQAGAEYKLLGKNSLNEFSMATPAIARDSLILRTMSNLFRIAQRP
jgi:outer membrane protein assembly factor BamB